MIVQIVVRFFQSKQHLCNFQRFSKIVLLYDKKNRRESTKRRIALSFDLKIDSCLKVDIQNNIEKLVSSLIPLPYRVLTA